MKLNKKILTGFFLLLILTMPQTLAANFSDVPDTHKYSKAIQTLKDAGIISGYGDDTFKPDKEISRAETVAIILKNAGIPAEKTTVKLPFSDVPEDSWFFPMIQKGVVLDKLKGYEDKTFRPNNAVTLPEAITLTLSFLDIPIKKIPVEPVIYEGLNTQDWYAKQMQYAKNFNLIEPDEKGFVDPAKKLTRGQVAEIIYRMRIVKQTVKPFDITENWIWTDHIDNFWKIKHPSGWEIFKGTKNSVIWKRDPIVGIYQVFFTRIWPKSAQISISLAENTENLTAAQYFSKLQNIYNESYKSLKPVFLQLTLSGKNVMQIKIPEQRILDLAIYLPGKGFLVVHGEYGEAATREFFKKQLEQIGLSYQFVEKPPEPPKPVIPLETRISTLLENILIAGKWTDIKDLFPDKKLISTDAIGIGTGPVDYYYSKEANRTIKLERNSGTVLNTKEGETTAF
ncbi:S-layer homology domain-containing protein [Candidatus Peregrinibacteria bacterium]|nr:S-layer homology domain-containing protein [Candidatus Peregrinibacteria bacterium]